MLSEVNISFSPTTEREAVAAHHCANLEISANNTPIATLSLFTLSGAEQQIAESAFRQRSFVVDLPPEDRRGKEFYAGRFPDGTGRKTFFLLSKKEIERTILHSPSPHLLSFTPHHLHAVIHEKAFEQYPCSRFLKSAEINRYLLFINENRLLWDNLLAEEPSLPLLRIHSSESGLSRTLLYFREESKILLCFNKSSDGLIGEGGSKKVKRAYDFVSGSWYALAVSSEDPNAVRAAHLHTAQKELQLYSDLSQGRKFSYVAQIDSYQEYQGKKGVNKALLCMPFYEGRSLQQTLDQEDGSPLTHEQSLSLGRDLLEGTAQFHKLGLLHQDIKPDNLLLNKEKNHAVLADYALAHKESDEKASYYKGSKPYFSFEHFNENLGALSLKADIWALGLTLGELFNLSFPLFGNPDYLYSINEILVLYLSDVKERVQALSEEEMENWIGPEPQKGSLEHLVWRMLRPHPQNRPSAVEALHEYIASSSRLKPVVEIE